MCGQHPTLFDLLNKLKISPEDVQVKKLTGGLSNSVSVILVKGKERYVYRENGPDAHNSVDRETEDMVLHEVSRSGICPKVHYFSRCQMLQEFAPGRTLSLEALDDMKIHRRVAQMLARLHKTPHSLLDEPWLDSVLIQYAQRLNNPGISAEAESLMKILRNQNSPIGLCHNDLRLNNIIYVDDSDTMKFVDFEYSSPNYVYFDIAHYFWQHEGAQTSGDFKTLSVENRREFVKAYTESSGLLRDDIETTLKKIKYFEAATHFLWSVWAAGQHLSNPQGEFDYQKNASARWSKYKECLAAATGD